MNYLNELYQNYNVNTDSMNLLESNNTEVCKIYLLLIFIIIFNTYFNNLEFNI